MKHLHYGHCLIGVAIALVLLVVLGVKASTLGILAVALACPLMMFVMMKTMMGDQSASSHHAEPAEQPSAENEGVRGSRA